MHYHIKTYILKSIPACCKTFDGYEFIARFELLTYTNKTFTKYIARISLLFVANDYKSSTYSSFTGFSTFSLNLNDKSIRTKNSNSPLFSKVALHLIWILDFIFEFHAFYMSNALASKLFPIRSISMSLSVFL